ncbi:MAG TPA: hypothetical protein VFZ09_08875 [Archangium sp.]|uniref:hypothetical protein n=1 Tax=Archangium sp. TaxID=1872627 RepID=UPI002E3660D2|nr:hypothetical protein [Archangium sp.]HEX5746345.1 hypothetical protein [Archangium sp.]
MKRTLLAGALALAGLTAVEARAEGEQPAAETAPAAEAPVHRFGVYSRGGVHAYLSNSRSVGVFGGSVGVRDIIQDRFILQADVGFLTNLGNAVPVQLAAGVQRKGLYSPAALLTLTSFFGERLTFVTVDHPVAIRTPPVALGFLLAPARFNVAGGEISLLEFGLGVSPEFPGWGVAYQLNLVSVGVSF